MVWALKAVDPALGELFLQFRNIGEIVEVLVGDARCRDELDG
jgi:hypothetical protein